MAVNIKPGVHEAMVIDHGVTKSKTGTPMAVIRFEYMDTDADKHQINWYGSFKEGKAAEITCEALATCGWTTNKPSDLAKGAGSGVLDETSTVSITLGNEEYNGKVTTKVKYINPPGGAGFRNAIEHSDAVQMFNGLNLEGVAAAARKKHSPKEPKNHAPQFDSSEPIPF